MLAFSELAASSGTGGGIANLNLAGSVDTLLVLGVVTVGASTSA